MTPDGIENAGITSDGIDPSGPKFMPPNMVILELIDSVGSPIGRFTRLLYVSHTKLIPSLIKVLESLIKPIVVLVASLAKAVAPVKRSLTKVGML